MTRRGALRRSLTLLLVLLMVTPQVLLRPCCCARESSSESKVGVAEVAETSALPPCCQKRLQAERKSVHPHADAQQLGPQSPGVHDLSKCGCRAKLALARSNRAVFKSVDQRLVSAWIISAVADQESLPATRRDLLAVARSAPPDWGGEFSIQLCRWLV